jgi:hypothetical protein
MNILELPSRDGLSTMTMAGLGTSFNLIDPGPTGSNCYSTVRWYNGTPICNTPGTNNFTLIAVLKPEFSAGNASVLGFKSTDNVFQYAATGTLDSYGQPNLSYIQSQLSTVPQSYIYTPKPVTSGFKFLAIRQNLGLTTDVFLDGALTTVTNASTMSSGISKLGVPFFLLSNASGSNYWDGVDGNGWSQCRFAMLMLFSRTLSQQELYDLYAAIMLGKGYGISRQNLEIFWLGRRDSTVGGDITTLPAYSAFDTARTTIPDLSGNSRSGYLFTNKTAWSDLLDSSNANANPGIYYPRLWVDNSYATNRLLTVNSSGSTLS